MLRRIVFALIATLGLPAFAQTTTNVTTLTLAGAEKVIAAAEAEAKRLNAPGGVIAVVDDGGNLIAVARMDGTFAAGANISIGKARTAALFKKPTKFFEDLVKNGRVSMVALSDFTPLQGGVPVTMGGRIVGAVGVSGAASAQQDEELAIAGAKAVEQEASSATTPVSYFPAREVSAAFDKGAVLDDGGGSNYMIHTSRREKPGMAEVHLKDADLIHVLRGRATFITGGTLSDSHNTAADEIRGTSISGGETRELHEGDVLVVPAGVPHQFAKVTDPFLYYVVKVR